MCIPAQHLPISVARDEGDLFDRKACFKKTARTFMTKVMKMKVFDFQISALPAKGCAYGSAIVRKDSPAATFEKAALFFDDLKGVIATDVKKWDALVVSVLATRVLAISNKKHLIGRVEVPPCDTTYFLLAHCGC